MNKIPWGLRYRPKTATKIGVSVRFYLGRRSRARPVPGQPFKSYAQAQRAGKAFARKLFGKQA